MGGRGSSPTAPGGRLAAALTAATLTAVATAPALAHGDLAPGENLWAAWGFDPWIVVPLILAAWVYLRGVGPAARDEGGTTIWQHVAFFAGLAVFYLVLQSPLEPISDHVFIAHQIEHMGLRSIGPMLVMLAAPQAALIRGLPRWARGSLLAPIVGNPILRGLFGVLAHPLGATVVFLAASYFWMIPAYHDLAILDEPVHYTWHVTLMLSGLIFFWRVFDPRPRPLGLSLPARLGMLWFGAMGNILLGAYLSFKDVVLYHAYDVTGRLWGIGAATDERFGGLTMWIPGAMMFAMSMLVIIHRWQRQEERADAQRRRRAARQADGAQAFLARRRNNNRVMAVGIASFVFFVFALSIAVAIAYDHEMIHV